MLINSPETVPAGIGNLISLITKVNSESFQGAAPGQAQYLGFDVEEVGQPGVYEWHHHFRYGMNRVVHRNGEITNTFLDEDWYWTWELERREKDAQGRRVKRGRKPSELIEVRLYERADLNPILGIK